MRIINRALNPISKAVLGSILQLIELQWEVVEPVRFPIAVCSDCDDDKFLEAAVAANAEYVVSGDAQDARESVSATDATS